MNPKEEKHSQEPTDDGGRISPKTRAYFWLASAVVVFVCAVVMCLTLIGKSADSKTEFVTTNRNQDELSGTTSTPTNDPSQDTTVTTEPPMDVTAVLEEPTSVNGSSVLNLLLIGYDEETKQTDTLMILSVDMGNATASMLSIPRDTYVSGGFTLDKINRVYSDRGRRGVASLKELVESMFGFRLDYYVLFNAESMEKITELTGAISFDVPSEPDYHGLKSGTQQISGADAFALFCFNDTYSDVETEPYFVQRNFLAAILDRLLADQSSLCVNCAAIYAAVETDLTAENIAYLSNLLKNFRFSAESTFSRALPGREVTVDGVDYYEVDAEEALKMLNEHFNPLETDLTQYDVNFRQKQADSGEGETSPWGFTDSTDGESEPTESETPYDPGTESEPTESWGETDEPTESTSESDEPTEPSETEQPTETEPPIETQPPEPSGGDDE